MDEDVLFVLGTPAPWAAASVSSIAGAKLACSPSARLAVVAAGSVGATEDAAWNDTAAGLQTDTWATLARAKHGTAATVSSAAAGIRGWLKANARLSHCGVRAVVILDGSHVPVGGESSEELAAAVEALAAELQEGRCHLDCLLGWGLALQAKPEGAVAAAPGDGAPPATGQASVPAVASSAVGDEGAIAGSAAEGAGSASGDAVPDAEAAAPTAEGGSTAPWPEEALLAAARQAGGRPPAVFVARSALELWDACAVLASSPDCRCVGEGGGVTTVAVGSLVHKFSSARKALSTPSE